jgi:hypothetical protein
MFDLFWFGGEHRRNADLIAGASWWFNPKTKRKKKA